MIIPLKGSNRHERRSAKKKPASFQTAVASKTTTVPISLVWSDEHGNSYSTRALLGSAGLTFEGTNERIPNSFLFTSQASVSATEAAGHYSTLKKSRSSQKFRKIFLSVFDQITDIDVGDVGGNSILLVDVPWAKELLPLPLFSGGTNRAAAILLSITHRQNGLVMVDEIENGIFHARQRKFSQALLELAREYETQLIMTTHSEEWINNFFEAADKNIDDIAFWRLERNKENVPTMRKFSLSEFRDGMAAGEMR